MAGWIHSRQLEVIDFLWVENRVLAAPKKPSEAEARSDAIARGDRMRRIRARRSGSRLSCLATPEPREWSCAEVDHSLGHGFACGFDGEIVCRIRDQSILAWFPS